MDFTYQVFVGMTAYSFSKSLQAMKPTKKDVLSINEAITLCQKADNVVLRIISLYIQKTNISVCTDGTFSINNDSMSQLGFLILFLDGNENFNAVHYGSIKLGA